RRRRQQRGLARRTNRLARQAQGCRELPRRLHLRRALARHQPASAPLGLARHALRPPRDRRLPALPAPRLGRPPHRLPRPLRRRRRRQHPHDDGREPRRLRRRLGRPERPGQGHCGRLGRVAVLGGGGRGPVRGCAGHVRDPRGRGAEGHQAEVL
ncbi:hypothetical protein LTR16_002364, partial [Cryomyces antarcticus]